MTFPLSDHFNGREFHNLDGVPAGSDFADFFRWKCFGGSAARWPTHVVEPTPLLDFTSPVPSNEVAATFVGHSSFLLRFAKGFNVLTDPVWSERVSPVAWAGPKRVRPPAIPFNALPNIKLVLVSHAHYDHLDLPTLRRVNERFAPLFLTGLGNASLLRSAGMNRVEEIDWWQASMVDDLEATFTPAQHWSKRSVRGRNTSLWGGFRLRAGDLNVFFAGDSGLGNHFATIRERLGPPDLALLPIGAYEPRWFMRDQHMNPADAVQAHRMLASRRSVGMHFGTFQLTDESIDQPAIDLAAALTLARIKADVFVVPTFGETIQVAASTRP